MPSIPSLNTGYRMATNGVIRSNAVFDMAFNQTTNMMKNQLNAYKPEATGLWNNFKKYFKVSNRYVVAKLRVGFGFIRLTHSCYCSPLAPSPGSASRR